MNTPHSFSLLLFMLVCSVARSATEPGPAQARLEGMRLTMANAVISATWEIDQTLRFIELIDRASLSTLRQGDGETFTIARAGLAAVMGSQFRASAKPRLERLTADSKAIRIADRFGGWKASALFVSGDGALRMEWQAVLRDGSHYIRQQWTLHADKDSPPAELTLINLPSAGAAACGEVDGVPVVAGNMFLACEQPMARNRVEGQTVVCSVGTFAPLKAGQNCERGSVLGVVPQGQLRRSFGAYIERERPRPYQPFLHYNSWYDIAWGDRKMNEQQCLAVIDLYGRELIEKRKVKLDSLVFDDGWDDNKTLWRFHPGFPNGFSSMREAAEKRGSAVGVWLSPWGGYGEAKKQRMTYGQTQRFETNPRGFSLAGPKYYGRFRDVCLEMIDKYNVNYFKFDGIAQGISAKGAGTQYAADVDALLRLIGDLRQRRPDVFVNVTTGTWPSPFWLLYCDSTWRNGGDMGLFGPGSKRQQWINYRDMIEHQWIVRRSPLYPLNSLMTQGIAQANLGSASQLGNDLNEFKDEVRSFFASGTQCQELYITPQLLSAQMWDVLAEAANWSRKNADVLSDVHWIGGDAQKGEAYGFAAWSPRQGMLSLRNPTDHPAKITIDIGQAFELPPDAPRQYRLAIPWQDSAARAPVTLSAGQAHPFELAPFEVLVFDAVPGTTEK